MRCLQQDLKKPVNWAKHMCDTKLEELTNYFWDQLKTSFGSGIILNGHEKKRLPNILNVSFINKVGQDLLSSIPPKGVIQAIPCLKPQQVSHL